MSDIEKAAAEALAIAKGEIPAARIYHNGHFYVPHAEFEQARARIEQLEAALQKMLDATCGPTGFAAAVRQAAGLAYPWPHLDAAEREARAALGEKP